DAGRSSPTTTAEAATQTHAVRRARRIEEARRMGNGVGQLLQRRQVIENPERSAVRRGDEVVVLDYQVVNWHNGEVTLQRLPARAVVKGYVYAELAAGVEQAPPPARGLLAPAAAKGIGRDRAGAAAPRLAVAPRT